MNLDAYYDKLQPDVHVVHIYYVGCVGRKVKSRLCMLCRQLHINEKRTTKQTLISVVDKMRFGIIKITFVYLTFSNLALLNFLFIFINILLLTYTVIQCVYINAMDDFKNEIRKIQNII